MNWKKFWFGLIAIGIPVVLLAQSIKWYNDAAIPQKTTLAGNEVMSLQQTGPNAYRWTLLSDLKRYVGASNVTIITTNNVVYGSNYYYNNTYVSNFFETNILNNTVISNYFFDFIYYTNIYQTNVTVNQYVSSDTYVSNFITTNIYNDTYTSNYFTTNLFPTTYVYVTNTIGGAFIANLGGMGTNTAFYGGTMFGSQLPNRLLRLDTLGFLDTLPNGSGVLTNDGFGGLAWEPLPTSSAQVWTNDGSNIRLYNKVPTGGKLLLGTRDTAGPAVDTNSIAAAIFGTDLYHFQLYMVRYGTNVNPKGFAAELWQGDNTAIGGGVSSDAFSYAISAYNTLTNTDSTAWLYDSDASYGVHGTAIGLGGSGAGIGVFGYSSGPLNNAGGCFLADASGNTQTNIGVVGVAFDENKTSGATVGGYFETAHSYPPDPLMENAVVIVDNRDSGYSLITARTNNGTTVFKVANSGDVISSGIYYGDGSGLTNLNVTATTNLTVYETINVKNLNVTSNIYYLNAKATNVTWVGPTNTVDFSLGTVQSYVTAGPISITNVIGEMAAYQNSTILCISNSSANVITNTLTATGWKLGRFDTLVCTNAGVIQIWLQNIGGMKTVAVREYP